MGDNIKVSVRLRDLIPREIQSKAAIYWEAKDKTTVSALNSSSNSFSYDRVFAGNESNQVVYDDVCAPIVESVINGFNGTIFAYGQTSSGKTYTLMGDGKFDLGIAHRSVYNLFEHIQNMADREFLLRVSLMEIYNNEKVIDLLTKKTDENLKLQDDHEGNCIVLGLTEAEVQEPDQVLELLKSGQKRRKTGETILNHKSSRSHLIFRMIIESRLLGNENAAVKVSHFNVVDLAGSEKPSDNGSGARFKEGVNINTSLLMLSNVINDLSGESKSRVIHYRSSKLTRILKNSLGGNALTAIICTITPASYDETISTLKFAQNAKRIKNKPQVNEVETEETLIRSYANKIKKLTKLLEATKEEKDQEAKIRRDMQEQIEVLKKKFVHFTPQNSISRSARRETWGGCVDLNRMKSHFQPSRTLKLPVVAEENEMTTDFLDIDKTFNSDIFRNRMSTVSSIYSIDSNQDEFSKKEDVAVQTDFLHRGKPCSEFSAEKENLKLYEKIAELEEELSDLKNFTTLEKQIYIEKHSETKVIDKSINRSAFSPFLEKLGKSDINLSVGEESFGVINTLVNRKSQADRNVIDLDQEMFFQNLNIMIGKLSSILNVKSLLPSITNPYFKVIYHLVDMIFQKHFIGNEILIDEQVKELFTLLTKIFVGFSDQENCEEQNSELIIHFDELSEKLLKDIEKLLKSSDTCDKTKLVDVPDVINVSCSETPNSLTFSNCQCKYQISLLEETINTHLETINHLQSNHKLLEKQIILSEDKIKAQEKVITSLENEIKLKIKCCLEMSDKFTQTSYMTLMNISGTESNDRTSLPKETVSCTEPNDITYLPKEISFGGDSNIRGMKCSICFKPQDCSKEQNASDPDQILSGIKSELSDLRLLTQRMMEDSMPKAYYYDIIENEQSMSIDSSSTNSFKMEIEALKNRLHKIKFYVKDRSEHSEHMENEILNKMAEISSLQRQCSSNEMAQHQKENLLNLLNADICNFRKEVAERRLSIRAMGVELKSFGLDDMRSVDDLTYLKKVMKSFADAVQDSHTTLKELLQQQALKQSKITQTVENYPDLAALEEVRAHEFRERAHLCQENASLKLKVEDLEQELKLKEDNILEIQKSYEEEMQKDLSRRKELEKNLMETMQNHIKDIEDKYEEELKNQEKSLFDLMDNKLTSLREEYKSEQGNKQEHYEKMISALTAECKVITSDLQSKLAEEVDNHEESKLKLEGEIRDFKNREEASRLAYYKLKDKFKEYVKSVQNMRMNNAKCVKEKETQTNTESTTAEVCNECKNLKQECKELKTLTKLKNSELASLESTNKNMMREITALKKDLAAKSALLLTCNCRLFAKPQDMVRDTQKTKMSDSTEVDQNQIRKKTVLDPKEILKLDFVQKAINEARESERALFNNGEGPASQEMCLLLRRKLAKKEKEISELNNMLSQKQSKVAQNPSKKVNIENIPMHPLDTELVNNFTPCIKTANKPGDDDVLKVLSKKILHDKNKPENIQATRNKWFMTEEEAEMAKKQDEDLQKYRSGESNCKQQ